MNSPPIVEDLFSLTPMQQGMLFHWLYAPESSAHWEQFWVTLAGELDPTAFRAAWKDTIARHAPLRAHFQWEQLDEPLQVIQSEVPINWTEEDWRPLSPSEFNSRLQARLEADQVQGFRLDVPPLMRFALVRGPGDRHTFFWSFHHILLDGWSSALVFRDVIARYEAIRSGQSPRSPRPRPFREYIRWLQGQDLAQAEAFWREQFRDFSGPTRLRLGRPIAASEKAPRHFRRSTAPLTKRTNDLLQALVRRERLTPNAVVQGAWALLLGLYSGESDVVFGVIVSGRDPSLPGVEEMVGLFVNNIPARVKLPENVDVLTWLHSLQAANVERDRFSFAPLPEILGWGGIAGQDGLPIESILAFENYPVDRSLKEGGATLRIEDVDAHSRTNYPLTIVASPGEDGLTLKIIADADRFNLEDVDRLLNGFLALIEAFVSDPHQKLGQVPFLDARERHRVLTEWNPTTVPFPRDRCIHELFEDQVVRSPDAVAAIFEDREWTYRTLNARANRLARVLREWGVGPDVLVGLCVGRSLEMLVGLLGILKAGGAYVPLDPDYPPQRLGFMLRDAGVSILLTQQDRIGRLPEHEARVVCLDLEGHDLTEWADDDLSTVAGLENLAYVLYTSGSTGKPKGVMMPHAPLVNLIRWECDRSSVGAGARTLQFASLSFDVSFQEIFATWSAGGTLVLVPDPVRADPFALLEFLQARRIDRLFVPFVALNQLAEVAQRVTTRFEVREVITAGEPLLLTPAVKALIRQGGSLLINEYGPTETHVASSFAIASDDLETAPTLPPIGRPIANARLYVLDSRRNPLPVGVVGEIYIGGDAPARGYLNRPELTAERFLDDPFVDDPNSRIYKTGDLGRWRTDGTIEFLGRADHQVKIRGYRVELGEVEAALLALPRVREAVVLAWEDPPKLVGYVVPADDPPSSAAELRESLRQDLPEPMIPGTFVLLDSLPLTPSGKVDRRALPLPDERPDLKRAFEPPRDAIEEQLCAIWRAVLKVNRVGVEDNFFELGGHSLIATQVVSRIRDELQVALPLRDLFELPTIAALAPRIGTLRWAESGPALDSSADEEMEEATL